MPRIRVPEGKHCDKTSKGANKDRGTGALPVLVRREVNKAEPEDDLPLDKLHGRLACTEAALQVVTETANQTDDEGDEKRWQAYDLLTARAAKLREMVTAQKKASEPHSVGKSWARDKLDPFDGKQFKYFWEEVRDLMANKRMAESSKLIILRKALVVPVDKDLLADLEGDDPKVME